MNHPTLRLSVPATALAVSLALYAAASSPGPSNGHLQPRQAEAPAQREYQGAASCSTVGCHGGSESKTGDASAYRIWLTRDPHARAFAVLHNERSQRIAANLAASKQKPIPPHEDARCLNCHVHPDAQSSRHAATFTFNDGVSCESCHGPAEGWAEEHWSAWKARPVSPEAREARGMTRTADVAVRARLCAGCHVGDRDRDVNHDLIAAGHPRLTFEYTAFMANMPKHWDPAKEKGNDPDRETQAWAIGQLASAQAALDLLAWRAGASQPSSAPRPWPEFAEYSCFSCHHDLAEPAWSKGSEGHGELAGRLRWGTWYFALAPRLADDHKDDAASPFALLSREMAQSAPKPIEIERLARAASERCGQVLGSLRVAPERVRELLIERAGDRRLDWDGAAQLYLAAAARTQALIDRGDRPNREEQSALKMMLDSLRFRGSYDSPAGSNKAAPEAFRTAIESYVNAAQSEPKR